MKKVSVVIPTWCEEGNVIPLTDALLSQFQKLSQYKFEILFIDNASTDKTQEKIRSLCAEHSCVKAIFNSKNFGGLNSPVYGLFQATGDCAILLCADFQDPIEMIPLFLEEWEAGHPIVCGIKTTSKENKLMYGVRTLYYKLLKKMSAVEQLEHFTGFALYDRTFLDFIKKLDDPTPFLRGMVAEYGSDRKEIPYEQQRRREGKTSTNLYWLYDVAMLSFTSYTKIGLRIATFAGFLCSFVSLITALVYFVLKLLYWNDFPMGTAPILIGVFLFGSLQLFFTGLLGEYILSINKRIMHRPLVLEKERLNFEGEAKRKHNER